MVATPGLQTGAKAMILTSEIGQRQKEAELSLLFTGVVSNGARGRRRRGPRAASRTDLMRRPRCRIREAGIKKPVTGDGDWVDL